MLCTYVYHTSNCFSVHTVCTYMHMAILLFCICSCQQYTDCYGFSTLYFPFFHISQVDEQLRRAQKLLKQSQKRDYYKILGVKRYALMYCTVLEVYVHEYHMRTYTAPRVLELVIWGVQTTCGMVYPTKHEPPWTCGEHFTWKHACISEYSEFSLLLHHFICKIIQSATVSQYQCNIRTYKY